MIRGMPGYSIPKQRQIIAYWPHKQEENTILHRSPQLWTQLVKSGKDWNPVTGKASSWDWSPEEEKGFTEKGPGRFKGSRGFVTGKSAVKSSSNPSREISAQALQGTE